MIVSPSPVSATASGLIVFGIIVSLYLRVWDGAEMLTANAVEMFGPPIKAMAPRWLRVILMLAAAGICGWAASSYRRVTPTLIWLAAILFLTGTFSPAMAMHGYVWEPFSAWTCATIVFVVVTTGRARERRRFRELERAGLLNRLGQATMGKLLRSKEPLNLDESTRTISLVTFVVRSHSEPKNLASAMNALNLAESVLLSKGGFLDTRSGSCIQVCFGVPREVHSHSKRACRAASALNEQLTATQSGGEIRFAWGLSVVSGEVVAGLTKLPDAQPRYAVCGGLMEEGYQLASANASTSPCVVTTPEVHAALEGDVDAASDGGMNLTPAGMPSTPVAGSQGAERK